MYVESKNGAAPKADSSKSSPYLNIRALVVDDNRITLKAVGCMMEELGFQVDTAEGGTEAIQALSRSRYTLVVTDYEMPEVDGYTLAGWLKHRAKQTRVIIMTGSSNAEIVEYMNTDLVDAWLFKPFGLNQLSALLSRFDCWGSGQPETS